MSASLTAGAKLRLISGARYVPCNAGNEISDCLSAGFLWAEEAQFMPTRPNSIGGIASAKRESKLRKFRTPQKQLLRLSRSSTFQRCHQLRPLPTLDRMTTSSIGVSFGFPALWF